MKTSKSSVITIATAIVVVVASVVYSIVHSLESGDQIRKHLSARDRAQAEARLAVSRFGRKADANIQRKADAVIRSRTKNDLRRKGIKGFHDAARKARKLRSVTKGSADPGLPDGELTAEEREILELANEAVSDEDLETACDVAAAALKSTDPRVRQEAVEALSSFGEAGLPELADFLRDSDEEVAGLAADRFELGLQEITNEREITAIAKLGMLTIDDPERLSSMAGALMLCNDHKVVVSALEDIIREGTPAQRSAAKEAYENETGEQWVNEAAAEKWLRENYTPDDEDREEGTLEDSQNEDQN